MSFVLTNGDTYCFVNNKKAVCIVQNINSATKFTESNGAFAELKRCSKKLKGYFVFDLKTEKIVQETVKTKRKSFTNSQRMAIYNKNKGRCAICGDFIAYDSFTIDHIIPLAKGGTNNLDNLQCACKICNLIKQDILPEELMSRLNKIVLHQMQMKFNGDLFDEMNSLRKERNRRRFRYFVKKIKKIGEKFYERQIRAM